MVSASSKENATSHLKKKLNPKVYQLDESPFPSQNKFKKEMNRMVELGVIEKVVQTQIG